tara:strand:+ start:389 stop:1306 length:918 start_codon:yes stop_codon:yes gene_type:complete
MISKNRKIKLRYGENPNQSAYLTYKYNKSIFDYQIHGKKISYNNIVDIDSGLRCLNEFIEPTSIIIKHSNACGVASDRSIIKAFQKSYESDIKSAFGGIIILNRFLSSELAKVIVKNFFELIVAPGFEKKALDILKAKKNLILLETPNFKKNEIDYRSTIFGDLHQSKDLTAINLKFIRLVSNKTAPPKSIEDLIFSLKVVKHLKSNAVVLTKNKQTIGLGHGHTNRVDALKQAIKNKDNYFKNKSFVCASDGFFPFSDSIGLLKKRGCNYIAQPSGSINDEKIISFAKKNNISLYFIKNRLFKH